MDELLSLKWKNHSSTLLKLLCNILSKDLYCDATIVCHDKYYPVHRLVLSTCSDFFKDIFARAHCKHPFIIINDVEPPEMEALLNFMYKGEVNILQKAVSLLIKAAESLKIKGLAVPDDSDDDDGSLKKFNKNPKNTNLRPELPGCKKDKINIKNKGSNDSESNPLKETVTSESLTCDHNLTGSGHLENLSDFESKLSKSDSEITHSMPIINALKTEPEDFEINSVDDQIFFKKPRLDDVNVKSQNFFDSLHTEEDPLQDLESKHMQSLTSFLPTSENILTKSTDCDWPEPILSSTATSEAYEEPSPEELMTPDYGETSSSALNAFSSNLYSERFSESSSETDCNAEFCRSTNIEPYISVFAESSNSRTNLDKINEISSATLYSKEYIESACKELTVCPYCSSDLLTEKKMRRHIIELHPGQNRFFCRLCTYSCKGNWHLRRHMLQHTGEKPYHCFICPFKTTTKQALNYHVFSHAGVKPFSCSTCPYKSTSLRGLKYHRLKYHQAAKKVTLQNPFDNFRGTE